MNEGAKKNLVIREGRDKKKTKRNLIIVVR